MQDGDVALRHTPHIHILVHYWCLPRAWGKITPSRFADFCSFLHVLPGSVSGRCMILFLICVLYIDIIYSRPFIFFWLLPFAPVIALVRKLSKIFVSESKSLRENTPKGHWESTPRSPTTRASTKKYPKIKTH